MNWIGSFVPGMNPGAGFGAPGTPTANSYDGRTQYTGTFGADQFNQTGNVNQTQNPANGPQLGGSGVGPGGTHYGPIPIGGWSQLGSRTNESLSGYYPTGPYTPAAGTGGYTPDSFQGSAPHAREPTRPVPSTPKPLEPGPSQPMMGQWGGGGWNVGSGAPASMQPMWLGSMNGGQTWAQAPGYNSRAPQFGQTTPMWQQAPNQDPDSPTWIQRGR